jgi:hypothetical protein
MNHPSPLSSADQVAAITSDLIAFASIDTVP